MSDPTYCKNIKTNASCQYFAAKEQGLTEEQSRKAKQ